MARRNHVNAGSPVPDRNLWVVPRQWLVLLAALVLLPWVIAAAFYARVAGDSAPAAGATSARAEAPALIKGDRRPWGTLELTPIAISPPLELVPTNWGAIEPPEWHVPTTDRDVAAEFLLRSGLPPEQVKSLVVGARAEAGGLVVTPDPALVRGLHPSVRASIYLELAKNPRNERQRNAYRFLAPTNEMWLQGAPISPRTRELVQSLLYRIGDFAYFADVDLVRPEITDPAELQRLAKRLFRDSTLLVRLRIDSPSMIEAAVEYWGRGGRRTDIRPVLESVASSADRSIDITHLLPPLAREHLYRYPRVSLKDLEKPSLANCFWTALNFFNAEPDDRYLDWRHAIERLKQDYTIVHDDLQLGDVVAFRDSAGNYFHVAVHLADGLVFGKNGTSHLNAWTILPVERLKGYYVEYADEWNVEYYRRKDL